MNIPSQSHMDWLAGWFEENGLSVWGCADLRQFDTPKDAQGNPFPRALSWAVPMPPEIMASIRTGPNRAYADAYDSVNRRIDGLSRCLADGILARGFRALPLAVSVRSDPVGIRGDFPHKTAAVMAGIGWIGRHCQLVTRPFGPWVRLGTVFTDMPLAVGQPATRPFCGACTQCVSACPAGALTGARWSPGIRRRALLDAASCDRWKKTHYFRFHGGHNCGICTAACPYGLKTVSTQTTGDATQPGQEDGKKINNCACQTGEGGLYCR